MNVALRIVLAVLAGYLGYSLGYEDSHGTLMVRATKTEHEGSPEWKRVMTIEYSVDGEKWKEVKRWVEP